MFQSHTIQIQTSLIYPVQCYVLLVSSVTRVHIIHEHEHLVKHIKNINNTKITQFNEVHGMCTWYRMCVLYRGNTGTCTCTGVLIEAFDLISMMCDVSKKQTRFLKVKSSCDFSFEVRPSP